ncbi:MAG: hypothetical protein ACJ75J_13805 [Cytophagaceae bacterium]
MDNNDNLTPEEKMRNLPGRLLGVFLIPVGLAILGMNYLLWQHASRVIRGGNSIGLVCIMLGLAALFLIPKSVTLGDFLNDRGLFVKKLWAGSSLVPRILWIASLGFSVLIFFYFIR